MACVHREDHALLSPPSSPIIFFLSLICLLFFNLNPEPCPPAAPLAQRREGRSQLQASLEPRAQRWRRLGGERRVGRDEGGECVPLEAETRRAKEVVERGGR